MRHGVAFAFVVAALGISPPRTDGEQPLCILQLVSASPAEFAGVSGKRFGPIEVLAAVGPISLPGPEGPRAWTIAVVHDPAFELVQVTMDGTSAGALLDPDDGFIRIDAIDPARNGGKVGYTALGALSLAKPTCLPADRASTLVSATYRGTFPSVDRPSDLTARFEFADQIVSGSGQVVNTVTVGNVIDDPMLVSLERTLKVTPACEYALAMTVTAPGATVAADGMHLAVETHAGQEFLFDAAIALSSALPGPDGAEGWSLSVRHDRSFFEIVDATTAGTDGETYADPEERYLKTSIVDDGDQATGFISAAILSLGAPRSLPPAGTFTIARARYRLAAPHDQPDTFTTTPIRLEGGLKEAPASVENAVLVGGESRTPCKLVPLRLEVAVLPGSAVFARGDANNDGRANVSDAVWLVTSLFLGGVSSPCEAAGDVNADRKIDSGDVVFLLQYLFRGGASVPPPFPRCGHDPDPGDPLRCDEVGVRCP